MFDVWGKTVLVANNMESRGVAGRVHVSEVTYQRANKTAIFDFDDAGIKDIEGYGEMKT